MTKVVQDRNDNLRSDSYNVLNRCQTEIHTS